MAFRKVVQPKYVIPKDVKPGTRVVENGVYIKKHNAGPGQYGDMISYHFLLPDGSVVGIPASGHMDKLVEDNLVIGQACHITLLGKDKFKNKQGKLVDFWNYEMEVDDNVPKTNPQDFPDTTGPSPGASSDLDISL